MTNERDFRGIKPSLVVINEDVHPIRLQESIDDAQKSMGVFMDFVFSVADREGEWSEDNVQKMKRFIKLLQIKKIAVYAGDEKASPTIGLMAVEQDQKSFVGLSINPQFHLEMEGDSSDRIKAEVLEKVSVGVDKVKALMDSGHKIMKPEQFAVIIANMDKVEDVEVSNHYDDFLKR